MQWNDADNTKKACTQPLCAPTPLTMARHGTQLITTYHGRRGVKREDRLQRKRDKENKQDCREVSGCAACQGQLLSRRTRPTSTPNVVVECLALLLRIWGAPGSNIGPKTSYSDWGFVVFLSPSRQMTRYCLKLGHGHFLQYTSQFKIKLSIDAAYSAQLRRIVKQNNCY
jgi:hypothetical protein